MSSSSRVVRVTEPVPGLAALLARQPLRVETSPERMSRSEQLRFIAGATAVVTTIHDRVDAEFLDAAGPQLRVVANYAAGTDNVDRGACDERGVKVCNTPGVLTDATADVAMGLLLAVTRRICEGDRAIRAGRPWSWTPNAMLGPELAGRRLGIVGLGRIGRAVARRAAGFDMDVVHHGGQPGPDVSSASVSFDELLEGSDAISLHAPLTPATAHIIRTETLSSVKSGAVLINTARGGLVHEADLVEALRRGRLGGAGLDVFEHEPNVHPALRQLDNVVLTPHLGSATFEARERMSLITARSLLSALGLESTLGPRDAR